MVGLLSKKGGSSAKEARMKKAESLAESKSWYKDRYQVVTVQRNILLVFTLICLVGLVGLVNYVAALSDSKVFEPFIVEVEDKTGIVTRVDTKSVQNLTGNEAVIRSLLARYVVARESYQHHSYYYNYHRVVRAFSADDVYHKFRYEIARSVPSSPLNLQDKASLKAEIKSMTFLEKRKVQIRVVVYKKAYPAGDLLEENHYAITVSFDFDPNKDLSQQGRYLNPLGFGVTGYSKDREFLQ